MTKPRLIPLFLALALAAGDLSAVGFESRRFTPYFNMSMSQGGYLPDKGAFFSGANMNMRAGLLTQIAEKHALFGLYNLAFSGQAFRFPDTQEFESKSMAHLLSFEYRWNINERWRLRPGISTGKTYTQTAAAEVWGQGLYDDKSLGTSLAGDFFFPLMGKTATVTGTVSRYTIKFPNYGDILREFQGADANTELAGGLKDQNLIEYSVGINRLPYRARIRMNSIDYKREKVVLSNATYGGSKQKDSNLILSTGLEGKLWIFEASPELSWQKHSSNQNFLLYRSATDPSPTFAPDYYDFTETSLNLPFFMNMTKRWALSLGLDWQSRTYGSRAPRDVNNTFTGGKQKNQMVTFSAGFRRRLNDVSSLYLNYSAVTASSNNKFERYLPYNYSGQGFSLGYSLTY